MSISRRDLLIGGLAVGGALLLPACGSGESSGGPPLTGKTVFNNGVTGAVSAEERAAALAAVESVWSSNRSQAPDAISAALVAQMTTTPAFRSGGTSSDGSCWGQFIDGQVVGFYVSNPNERAPTAIRAKAPRPPAPSPANEISLSPTAYIFHALPWAPDTTVNNFLARAGYSLRYSTGTIADWQAMTNAGIVINISHGLMFIDPATFDVRFMQQTADHVSAALDVTYEAMLKSGMLSKIAVTETDGAGANPTTVYYYALTSTWPGFTSSSFSPNCLFFNESCLGFGIEEYRDALFGLGLGVYAGWTYPVVASDAAATVNLFFDRALGINEFDPIDPKKPEPLAWQEVLDKLSSIGRPDQRYRFDRSVNPKTGGASVLRYASASNLTLNTLIPSIASLELSAAGTEATLSGSFGSEQGTAAVGTTSVAVSSWTATRVALTLPPGTSGDVQLTVHGLLSNAVPLASLVVLPATAQRAPGERQTFMVTPPDGAIGTIYYDWTQNSAFATLSASDGKVGNKLTGITVTTVDLVTTPSDQAPVTVSVVAYTKKDGTKTQLGKGSATVSFGNSVGGNVPAQILVRAFSDDPATRIGLLTFRPTSGTTYRGVNKDGIQGPQPLTPELLAHPPAPWTFSFHIPSDGFYGGEPSTYEIFAPRLSFYNLGGGVVGYYALISTDPNATDDDLKNRMVSEGWGIYAI